MIRLDDNHQNCAVKLLALQEPQSSEFPHRSIMLKNYIILAYEQLTVFHFSRVFSLQNLSQAWNLFFVRMLHSKLQIFDHYFAERSKMENVDLPLE